jgi:hypothetical protein
MPGLVIMCAYDEVDKNYHSFVFGSFELQLNNTILYFMTLSE